MTEKSLRRSKKSDDKKSPISQVTARPFLRWVGGKQNMLHHILPRFIPREEIKTYAEPFLGAASVFLALAPSFAVLADANPHLIACYRAIRNKPRSVGRALAKLKQKRGKQHYYAVRKAYNHGGSADMQAARFIYLNRTCFNGIFRVNRIGQFNVPRGDKSKPTFPSSRDLITYSRLLRKAQLRTASFDVVLRSANKTWFVYLDPPRRLPRFGHSG